jgi:hypothetical protein
MRDADDQYEFPLTLRVPKTALVLVSPAPATVTQRTAEQHFGIPRRAFLRMVRDGLFPAKRVSQLVFAAYEDVRRAVTEGAVARTTMERAVERTVEELKIDELTSEDEARRYLTAARTPAELGQRKREVAAKGRELERKYGRKLDNGRRNQSYDKTLYNIGSFMSLYAAVARWPMPPYVGPKGPCGSCSLPAYATRQAWERGSWQGRPVCKSCAQDLAPNERIIQYPEEKILVSPRDPTVPMGDQGKKRRRVTPSRTSRRRSS